MKNKLTLLIGIAVGYVLGSRAGRERYDQLKADGHPRRRVQALSELLPHPATGDLFPSPVPPGTGWPGDPATADTPVAGTAAGGTPARPDPGPGRARRPGLGLPRLPAAGPLA